MPTQSRYDDTGRPSVLNSLTQLRDELSSRVDQLSMAVERLRGHARELDLMGESGPSNTNIPVNTYQLGQPNLPPSLRRTLFPITANPDEASNRLSPIGSEIAALRRPHAASLRQPRPIPNALVDGHPVYHDIGERLRFVRQVLREVSATVSSVNPRLQAQLRAAAAEPSLLVGGLNTISPAAPQPSNYQPNWRERLRISRSRVQGNTVHRPSAQTITPEPVAVLPLPDDQGRRRPGERKARLAGCKPTNLAIMASCPAPKIVRSTKSRPSARRDPILLAGRSSRTVTLDLPDWNGETETVMEDVGQATQRTSVREGQESSSTELTYRGLAVTSRIDRDISPTTGVSRNNAIPEIRLIPERTFRETIRELSSGRPSTTPRMDDREMRRYEARAMRNLARRIVEAGRASSTESPASTNTVDPLFPVPPPRQQRTPSSLHIPPVNVPANRSAELMRRHAEATLALDERMELLALSPTDPGYANRLVRMSQYESGRRLEEAYRRFPPSQPPSTDNALVPFGRREIPSVAVQTPPAFPLAQQVRPIRQRSATWLEEVGDDDDPPEVIEETTGLESVPLQTWQDDESESNSTSDDNQSSTTSTVEMIDLSEGVQDAITGDSPERVYEGRGQGQDGDEDEDEDDIEDEGLSGFRNLTRPLTMEAWDRQHEIADTLMGYLPGETRDTRNISLSRLDFPSSSRYAATDPPGPVVDRPISEEMDELDGTRTVEIMPSGARRLTIVTPRGERQYYYPRGTTANAALDRELAADNGTRNVERVHRYRPLPNAENASSLTSSGTAVTNVRIGQYEGLGFRESAQQRRRVVSMDVNGHEGEMMNGEQEARRVVNGRNGTRAEAKVEDAEIELQHDQTGAGRRRPRPRPYISLLDL
ncbi:hypothetical protein TREMEDRAFT_63105 [Tremella mesenterica DSM 1558]|uniref:uncharacterized protein n=1 Tax=Tremella mesenterica (strain ATCC 24925 / CBS 8224 / DSM 1558 / NBRC 9311 / NRRL Y-6157 / RJB 2259-6 / UBC 559-6) TaxID=578456 RepID=UPI0003F48BFC|nr:uncharacterized protein TREMEDRAFT_63105 [Tremella mesenterica DSM 1558]EIW68638.1 hypothetical protein TREMEDRAFT_63105 [Tremella mesenterica DSM 1558]